MHRVTVRVMIVWADDEEQFSAYHKLKLTTTLTLSDPNPFKIEVGLDGMISLSLLKKAILQGYSHR